MDVSMYDLINIDGSRMGAIDNIRSDVIEEISSEMNGPCLWTDNENDQRGYVDCRMEEQEGKPLPEIIASTTEEDLGYQLNGLTSNRYVVEQGNRISPGAIGVLE